MVLATAISNSAVKVSLVMMSLSGFQSVRGTQPAEAGSVVAAQAVFARAVNPA